MYAVYSTTKLWPFHPDEAAYISVLLPGIALARQRWDKTTHQGLPSPPHQHHSQFQFCNYTLHGQWFRLHNQPFCSARTPLTVVKEAQARPVDQVTGKGLLKTKANFQLQHMGREKATI
jgi:hypothetical protein